MNFIYKFLFDSKLFIAVFVLMSCKSPQPTAQSQGNRKFKADSLNDSSRLTVFRGDTIDYLNYVIRNQEKYKGKPLSFFLDDFDLTVKRFGFWTTQDRTKVYNISLIANDANSPGAVSKRGERTDIQIEVRLQTFVPIDSIRAIRDANGIPGGDRWSKEAAEYFGKKIVENLWLNYDLKKD